MTLLDPYGTRRIHMVKLKNYSDRTLEECWRAIEREGKADRVCVISDPVQWGAQGFIRQVRRGQDIRVVLINEKPVAVIWIESVRPKRAQIHWHLYETGIKEMFVVGRHVVDRLYIELGVDLLYGFTPVNNEQAIRYLKLIGGRQVGTLPGGSYIAKDDSCIDSAIIVFQRTP